MPSTISDHHTSYHWYQRYPRNRHRKGIYIVPIPRTGWRIAEERSPCRYKEVACRVHEVSGLGGNRIYRCLANSICWRKCQAWIWNISDRNRKLNNKCNNEACGRELGWDGETIKGWILEFGLSDYAYNPERLEAFHRKKK